MTKNETRQMLKNEALNKIRKIYKNRYNFPCDRYDESSHSEQIEYRIETIINVLETELLKLKEKK